MKRSLFAVPLALSLALGVLAFVPAVGNAGLIVQDGPALDTSTALTVNYKWTFAPSAASALGYTGANWDFKLDEFFLSGFQVLTISDGVHKLAPHGEAPSTPAFNQGIILTPSSGGATVFGTILHQSSNSGHSDQWKVSSLVWQGGAGADVTVSAVHVPEPSSLALLGVGSLIGLGVYTRRRRKNA